MSDLAGLQVLAEEAARIAGRVIMPLYAEGVAVELKADRTPVTMADHRAEEAMREFFERETPGFGVLGEEFGEREGQGRYRWVIDPIDGTKAFIHHVPLFGTLVALEEDGLPVVGVIACHAAGETVSAARGLGASLEATLGERTRRPARVSAIARLQDATVLTTSSVRLAELHPGATSRLDAEAGLVRTWGDCYGYLTVAAGRADAMLDPVLNRWDVSALFPVITEAGGRITTFSGEERAGESAVATNGLLHDMVLAILAGRP